MKTAYTITEEQFAHLYDTLETVYALLVDYMQYENEEEPSLEQEAFESVTQSIEMLSTINQNKD
jgi:hypothetical protein